MSVFDDIASGYSDDELASALAEVRSWYQEVQPNIDAYDVVVTSVYLAPLAVQLVKQRRLVSAISTYGNLSPIPSSSLADDELLALRELQAKAFGLTLGADGYATGDVRLTFSTNESIVIPDGTLFSVGQQLFRVNDYYSIKTAAEYRGETNQRKLVVDAANRYYAIIGVTATVPGTAGNLLAGTTLTAASPISRLVAASTESNLSGGTSPTDLAALLAANFDSLVAKTMGSRDQIIALIRQEDSFSNLKQFGVVGCGDPEMQRDKASIIPLGTGRCDVYAASSSLPVVRTISLTASYVSDSAGITKLVVAIDRDVAPGFYDITGVTTVAGVAVTIDSLIRDFNVDHIYGEQVPYIEEISHATFSRFQTGTLSLSVATSSITLSPTNTVTVLVSFRMLPNIAELQTFLSERSRRYPGGDTLVRAAVPVYLTLILTFESFVDDYILSASEIVDRVVSTIQARPLRTGIYGSEIISAIADLLDDKLHVTDIQYSGRMILPSGDDVAVGGSRDFFPILEPKSQTSARTVAMYVSSANVAINVNRVIQTEVP